MIYGLEGVKEGETIIIWHTGFYPRAELAKVTRATATIVSAGGYRFLRRTGNEYGRRYSGLRAERATPANLENAELKP